jgi:thioredoxin-related protein
MNNHTLYILIGLLLFISCGQKPDAEDGTIELSVRENQQGNLINTYNDSLFFNFSDTLSKYNKPILFYMRTDWCRGCKSVEQYTVNNEEFRGLVNANFQFYKIDGDLPFQFYLQDSVYKKNGLMNDFMYAFYQPSEMASYPSYMIINKKEEVATVIPPQFKSRHVDMVNYFISLAE